MNTKSARLLASLILLILAVLTASCDNSRQEAGKAPQPAVPVISVIPSKEAPEKRVISIEVIPQPNCGGSSIASNAVERSHTIIHTMEVSGGVSVNASGGVGVPGVGEVQVGAEVAAEYGLTYGQQETLSHSLIVSAKEGTNMRHTIQQLEYWNAGEVLIAVGDSRLQPIPYKFREGFGVELVQSENIGCPSPTPGGSASPMAAPTEPPTQTPAPSSTPTLGLTPTNTSTATSNPTPLALPTVQPSATTTGADVAPSGKAVGEFYAASGIQLGLDAYSIAPDGTIGLKFTAKNEANQRALLRYQNSYFSLSDDTGKVYPQTQDFLLDKKQADLSPGDSFKLESNSWPDTWREVGVFKGKVPEQASQLIVKVAQFADLRDMQWAIPLNPQLARPQAPVPGTQQPVMEGFSANGITLLLSGYEIASDGTISLKFLVQNEGNNAVLLRYQNKYFEVYDDRNNNYPQVKDFLLDPKQVLLSPGDSFKLESNSWPDTWREVGAFRGKVPEQASQLIVKVAQFADLRDMQWAIPLR
jgi:hypothetical protein